MVEVTRHFTATTYVLFDNHVLLHFHKKLKIWIPVGGHIDRDELPPDAAVREVKEETGLDVELILPKTLLKCSNGEELIGPFHIMLHNINEFHQHIDMVYFAKSKTDELNVPDGESDEMKWFSREDLENDGELLDDVKIVALELLDLAESKSL